MFRPSNRIGEIIESETLAMTKRARELRESGKDIISLSIGEPDFNTPEHICNAAYKAMQDGFTHYPPVTGLIQFREAICRKLENENDLHYQPNEIIVSNGAKHSIINAVLSLVNPGDEVIIPAPYWVSYPSMVTYAGGVPVYITAGVEKRFKFTAEDLKGAITDKTKLLIFSSPCNPSGSVFSENELREIATVLQENPHVFVISDEIYEKINYVGKHVSIGSFPGMKERTAVVNGLAKGYAMTGWRIGYLAGPSWLVSACEKMQGLFTSGANSISQMAGISALEGNQNPVLEMRETFRERRNLLLKRMSAIPDLKMNVPDGAFYIFPDVSAYFGRTFGETRILNAEQICMYLLNEAGVATVSGAAFGLPECIRISYATDFNSIEKAIDRMTTALAKLS